MPNSFDSTPFRRLARFAAAPASVAAIAWLSSTLVFAQPPGGSERGGERRRGFDPEEMISRLDENKNGQIDPEEMQGRARFFLEGIARDNGLDLSQPIPAAKLRELMQARFQQGGPPRDGGRPQPASTAKPTTAKAAVVMPNGFGVETKTVTKVPGFGTVSGVDSWDTIKAKYEPRIVERVEDSLKRYDKNQDGILDAEEIKNGQWRGDPQESDKNRDGKLSRSELAERHLLRERNGGGQGGPNGPGAGRPAFGGATNSSTAISTPASSAAVSSSPKTSAGSDERVAKYAEGLLNQYDANKDGVLQKDEWSKMRGEPKKSDRDNNDLITKEELAAHLSNYGLPDWFTRCDTNGDGQVAMGEFSAAWDDAKAAEFARWDRNGDGLITPRECTGEK
ncbi:MAG: hypothetical protein K8U03_13900 [Planctomycetia bacterium]|nr:hypothetical protein [Planctomycetia bacterium]